MNKVLTKQKITIDLEEVNEIKVSDMKISRETLIKLIALKDNGIIKNRQRLFYLFMAWMDYNDYRIDADDWWFFQMLYEALEDLHKDNISNK